MGGGGVVVFGTLYSLQYLVNTSKSCLMQTTKCQPQSKGKKRSVQDDFSERNFCQGRENLVDRQTVD